MTNQGILIPKDVAWRKATRSLGQGACVEIASIESHTAVRDSKDPSGPALVFANGAWAVFVEAVKRGRHG